VSTSALHAEQQSKAVEARQRESEAARAEEVAQQRKVFIAQVEAEKAELERIQIEKKWIAKRLDDLAAAKPMPASATPSAFANNRDASRRASASASAVGRDEDTLSNRDRVLADKQARKSAENELERLKLVEGRRDAYEERLKVQQATKGAVAPHLISQMGAASAARYSNASVSIAPIGISRPDSEYDDDEFDQLDRRPAGSDDEAEAEESEAEAEEDLAQEAEAIEEAESLMLGLTKRIQDLRTSIQVPSMYEYADAAESEEEEVEEDEEAEEAAIQAQQQQQQRVIAPNLVRMKALAK
jgi:hypothetical protein